MRRILAVLLVAAAATTGLSLGMAPAGAANRFPWEVVSFRGNCTTARSIARRTGAGVERERRFCEVERQFRSLRSAQSFQRRFGGSVEAS